MNGDQDALDHEASEPAEPMHDAIQTGMRDALDHDDILVRHVLISEWVCAETGRTYLCSNTGADTQSWHARGLLAEGIAMIDQSDTHDTILHALDDEDSTND